MHALFRRLSLLLLTSLVLSMPARALEENPSPVPPEAPAAVPGTPNPSPSSDPDQAAEAAPVAPAAGSSAETPSAALEAPREARTDAPRSSAGARTRQNQIVRIGESYTVKPGERVGDTVVIGGSLHVSEGGLIDGDAVVVLGDFTVEGEVRGDMVSVLGSSRLGETARVGGDYVSVGASDVVLGALVKGEEVRVGLGANRIWQAVHEFLNETVLLGRPWAPSIPWMWALVGTSLALAFLIALIFGAPYREVVRTTGSNPALSIGAGLLVMIALPPVCLILLALAVGVLIVPFLMAAAFGATLVGMSAAGALLGRSLGLRGDTQAAYALATLVGCAIGFALLAIPFMGIPLLGLLVVWGLGATTLAAWRGLMPKGSGPAVSSPDAQPPVEPSRAQPATVPAAAAAAETPSSLAATAFASPVSIESSAPTPSEGNADQVAQTPPPVAPPPLQSAATAGAAPAGNFSPLPSAAERRAARLAESEGRVGFWPRAAAVALDLILVGMTMGILSPASGAFPVIFIAYSIGMWVWKGTTIGGAVMRLRVQRLNGDSIDFGTALVRGLVSVLSIVALGIGWFWAGSSQKQAWQDIVAGTVVVRLKPGVSVF